MTLHIFLISRCLAENFIWEQSYLLFSFQKQDSQARSCHSLSPVFLLSEGAWFGSQLPLKSRGARSTLRSHSGPSWGWTIIFKGYSDNLNAPQRQSCNPISSRDALSVTAQGFLQILIGVPPSRETITNTVQLQWLLHWYLNLLLYPGVAPAAQAWLSITDLLMRLHLLTERIRLCSHGAHWEVLSFSSYPSETGLTESNPLSYKNCTLFWKSKCK